MWKNKISLILILSIAIIFSGSIKKKYTYKDIYFQTFNGDKIYLNKIKDQLIIIDFWATWCYPCRATIPKLISVKKKFKDKVIILGASLDTKISKKELIAFAKHLGINYHIGFANKVIYKYFGSVREIPTIFIIAPTGKILDKTVGYDPNFDVKVEYYIKKLHIKGKRSEK